MREIDTAELKQLQLGVLDEVDRFCRANNIHYWLDCGTLIGAIRHKGYIPWDDDIDIGMLREDFDRFIQIFVSDRYRVIANDLDKGCYYPFAKVLDTNTVLYEPDENGIKLSVNIDVFVYDLTPDEQTAKKQYDIRDRFRFLSIVQYGLYRTKKWYKRIPKDILHCVLQVFPRGFYASKVARNSKKYMGTDSKFVGNFTAITRMLCDKSVFDSFIMKEFEGKEYPVPVGYDAWLRSFYGDYMELPPVEQRVAHHMFKAFAEDNT